MPDRIPTNIRKEAKVGMMGFEGVDLIVFLFSILFGFVMFRGLLSKDVLFIFCLVIGLIPITLSAFFVFGLRRGKPASYAMDFILELFQRVFRKSYHEPSKLSKVKRHDT